MGLIKEPLNVDFEVDPKPLTQEEREAISQYILDYKTQKAKKQKSKSSAIRRKVKKQGRKKQAK